MVILNRVCLSLKRPGVACNAAILVLLHMLHLMRQSSYQCFTVRKRRGAQLDAIGISPRRRSLVIEVRNGVSVLDYFNRRVPDLDSTGSCVQVDRIEGTWQAVTRIDDVTM